MLGPWGFKLVSDVSVVQQIGDIGIVFLLFLLGLHLQPQNLVHMLKKITWIAIISSVLLAVIAYSIGRWFGLGVTESWILGAAMMFSSTIIGLKLLPTTILHHQHTGEVMISILLMQDVIAIVVLILINGAQGGGFAWNDLLLVGISLPVMTFLGFVIERHILVKLLARFDRTQEYVFYFPLDGALACLFLRKSWGYQKILEHLLQG